VLLHICKVELHKGEICFFLETIIATVDAIDVIENNAFRFLDGVGALVHEDREAFLALLALLVLPAQLVPQERTGQV
jgi:hypothetical protein